MDSFKLDLAALIASAPTVPTSTPTQVKDAEGMTFIDLATTIEAGQPPVDEERSHGSFTGFYCITPCIIASQADASFPTRHQLGPPPSRVQQPTTDMASSTSPVSQPYLYSSDICLDHLVPSNHNAVFGQFSLFIWWPADVEGY
ncbi:hypothetical protein GGF50DRAFT_127493 [Schizophyllum commune]